MAGMRHPARSRVAFVQADGADHGRSHRNGHVALGARAASAAASGTHRWPEGLGPESGKRVGRATLREITGVLAGAWQWAPAIPRLGGDYSRRNMAACIEVRQERHGVKTSMNCEQAELLVA